MPIFNLNPGHQDYHLLGSQYDAQKRSQSHAPLKVVIVIAMLGYNLNYDYGEVISDSPSKWIADSVYAFRDRYLPDLLTHSSPGDVPYSDHDSYLQKGYSAILIRDFSQRVRIRSVGTLSMDTVLKW